MTSDIVLYHGGCWDGFCAAWIARNNELSEAEFLPVQYGQQPPDVCGKRVFIFDFSYKRPVMEKLINDCSELYCFDHHKTAELELKGLVNSKAKIVFDVSKSGGRLAAEYFRESSWLVDYTEDRDLWKWVLPSSREINEALRSYPLDFDAWDKLHLRNPEELIFEGSAILRASQKIIDSHVSHAVEMEVGGHRVLGVNATCLISEIAGELAKRSAFGVCWFRRQDGAFIYSLRSCGDNAIDVSRIAATYGGGGHLRAAGFESSTLLG